MSDILQYVYVGVGSIMLLGGLGLFYLGHPFRAGLAAVVAGIIVVGIPVAQAMRIETVIGKIGYDRQALPLPPIDSIEEAKKKVEQQREYEKLQPLQ